MTRPRLIPCLLLKNGLLVRSQFFRIHQLIGTATSTIRRLSNWDVDELVLLDISDEDDAHDIGRDDLQVRNPGPSILDVIRQIAEVCLMPLSVGGRIGTLSDIRKRLAAGADKCIINTKAVEEPDFVTDAAAHFGSQCIVVSIDVKQHDGGRYEVYTRGGTEPTGLSPAAWAAEVERAGAGEIFLNSIDRDGTASGYDLGLIRSVVTATSIPVIACGGVGRCEHFPAGVREGGASAVSAANIFHFFELSYPMAKRTCLAAGLPMRPARVGSRWFRREPAYDVDAEDRAHQQRIVIQQERVADPAFPRRPMRWCRRCVAPLLSAIPTQFDETGVCTGCRAAEAKFNLPSSEWERRRTLLRELLQEYRGRSRSGYDCIIPVSGGKDSYFQTHMITREFGLHPLLVTYHGNNYTEAGWRNVHRMKEVFGVDHIFFSPSVQLLKKLNNLGFVIMGDMNWHAHVGIKTYPVQVAVQAPTPLIIWGEHGQTDLSGQFSMNDFPEMTYRDRLEYYARGYEWNYFVGHQGITDQDMNPYRYPSDRQLWEVGVRGIHLGHYLKWEANDHGRKMIDLYGFEVSDEPFDRTYRRISNLDDMHENGVHDYLKYIKFGYGRATDHACKDIRAGLITREQGIRLVRRYDHVKPRDLGRWLIYVGMSESEFDRIADTFRNPRVWRLVGGEWIKDNIWEQKSAAVAAGQPAA